MLSLSDEIEVEAPEPALFVESTTMVRISTITCETLIGAVVAIAVIIYHAALDVTYSRRHAF